ncbi:MAG: CBS domain-containing protein [Methanomicrobiales archaeon]|nr:CBS domain-containing protein [Methanomicrobiales archaeon]
MKVQEIMTQDVITIDASATIREAAALLRKHKIGGIPVTDEGELVGIITETDIVSLLKTEEISDDLWLPSPLEVIELPIREYINWQKTKRALQNIGDREVRSVMAMPVVTVSPEADIEEAAALMMREDIARVPVVRGTKLVGIITRADIVKGVGTVRESSTPDQGGE